MKPLATEQALFQATVRDYARGIQRLGGTPDMRAIEKQARADLELVDAYGRSLKTSPPKKDPKPRAERMDELDVALQDLQGAGARIVAPDKRGKRVQDRALKLGAKRFAKTVWWWPHAVKRIKRILQGAKGTTLEQGLRNAECPALAREFAQHWSALIQRRMWSEPTALRPYDGIPDEEAERRFIAAVESICERSKRLPGLREWRFR